MCTLKWLECFNSATFLSNITVLLYGGAKNLECRTPTSKILQVTGHPQHPQWLHQCWAVIFLHLFWQEPLQISGTGFLRVICSYAFHLVSSTQSKHWSKLKALTPTRGLASSSLHSPLTPEEPGVAAFMWAPWRQSLSTGTEVMVHA